jgi:effector-binding domain-containing protein
MTSPDQYSDDRIDLKDVPALTMASVESKGSFERLTQVFMDLFRWVLVNGGKVTSYPMALFPAPPGEIPAEGVRFEACIPIDPESNIKPGEGVSIRQLPASTVAFTRHQGGFGDVGKTYDRLLEWVGDNGYEVAGPSRELYLTNPLQTEEGELVTEIQIPVKTN